MQSFFDLPMSASFSYIFASIVILGLLGVFAIIVRRVASQGPNPDGSRGRGPRLGVVDTYSLDRNRQLVIVRRDDVEHLLMIGGTNDILIESNIIRSISAQAIREPQTSLLSAQPPVYQQFDTPKVQNDIEDDAFIAPQTAMSVPPQAPRLKPLAAPAMPQAQMRPIVDNAAAHPPVLPPQQQVEMAPQPAQTREALNNAELQALAKRLEASIPQLPLPKAERSAPPAPQPSNLVTEPKAPSAPQFIQPPQPAQPAVQQSIAPQPVMQQPVSPQPQSQQPLAPQPVPTAQQPQMQPPPVPTAQQPQMSPQAATPQPRPQMPPPPMPLPQKLPASTKIASQAMPIPAAAPQPPQNAPKDQQATALDENLRRLLGRKLDPR